MSVFKEWKSVLLLAVLLICAYVVQFSVPVIIGADGYLHGRMAEFILDKGFIRSLPQAHFSWFVSQFSDKDFLYHLYLAPFVKLFGYISGTKTGAFIATSVLLCATSLLIHMYGGRRSSLLITLFIFLSPQFMRDTAEARPLAFAYLLLILGIHWAIQKKPAFVFFCSVLYGMMHLSAWTLPVVIAIITVFDWLATGEIDFRLALTSTGGYLLSFIIHPNFPNNIFFTYLNGILVPLYAAKTGVLELGAEFFPLNTLDLLHVFPIVIGGLVWTACMGLLVGMKSRKETLKWGIAWIFFALLGLISKRNLTQGYPLFLLFLASVSVDFQRVLKTIQSKRHEHIMLMTYFATIIVLSYSLYQTLLGLQKTFYAETVYGQHFESVSAYLNSHAKPGSRVFHANWSDSQYLIGLSPQLEYIVTLDPIYMYNYNPQLYDLYRAVSFGKYSDPYQVLRDVFDVQYVYAGKNYFSDFIQQMKNDTRFRIEKEDDLGVVASLQKEPLKQIPKK
jgi:hypothetical protein